MASPIKLRVVTNAELDKQAKPNQAIAVQPDMSRLAAFLNTQWQQYMFHNKELHDKCLAALRAYKGKYDETKLQEIKQFGGSEVYSGITSVKCRSATALLRDVYLGTDRPWGAAATPVPDLPDAQQADINELVIREAMEVQNTGVILTPQQINQRRKDLMAAAQEVTIAAAAKEARIAEEKLDDILTEGKFYKALIDFLVDMPIFPYAVIKGPVVQNSTELKWSGGKLGLITRPRMFWYRVRPMDLYFAPGASDINDAGTIEHIKINRTDLNNLKGLPGYDTEAIDKVLENYKAGWYLANVEDSRRAALENRDDPARNFSQMLDGLEWQGAIRGDILLDHGFTPRQIPNKDIDYNVTTWWIGQYVIKAQLNPNPQRPNQYYVSCFEKTPGSISGSGLPEIIDHVQSVGNACLRSLVNNLSISSGPQVSINEDRISPHTNPDDLYPWKRWRFTADIYGNSEKPIEFFQPQSNAQELLTVYTTMSNIADDISAIPKYLSGSEKVGGAARTASGLYMLMNNASKMLQNVAANIDSDVMQPCISDLYTIMMLTDTTGTYRGDTEIVVKGVKVATQHETDRLRKLEYLQLTANPIDAQIVGPVGRAAILRDIAEDLGMPGSDIVPSNATTPMLGQLEAIAQQPPMPAEAGARPAETVEGMTQHQRL